MIYSGDILNRKLLRIEPKNANEGGERKEILLKHPLDLFQIKKGSERVGRQQITIRLPDELREQVQKKADDEGQSFNAELIILLLKGLEVE